MDINDLPSGYFAGGDIIACERCGNRVLDGACCVCGAEPEREPEHPSEDDRWLWHRMQAEFAAWGTK